MEIKRLSALDSIRGIAAMGVAFFWHYTHFNPKIYPFAKKAYWFYNFGFSLVDLFFVLSGFVFCYVYKKRIAKKELSFREYSIMRFSRLYPLMFTTLIVVSSIQILRRLLHYEFFIYKYNDVYHFIMNIFFIHSGWFESGFSFNGPSWSISCEVVAYILFYFIVYKLQKDKTYIAGYIFVIFVGLFIVKTKINYPLLNENMSRVFIAFFVGCLTFEFNDFINNSKHKKLIITMCAVIFLGITISSAIFGRSILGNWFVVFPILVYPLIILLSLNISILNKLLSLKPFVYIGDLSFSIYLWHFPVQISIKTIDDIFKLHINYSSKFSFFTFVIITLVVSALSYELIEKPSNRYLRKKLTNKTDQVYKVRAVD